MEERVEQELSVVLDDVGSHFAALDDRNGAAGDEITVVILKLIRIENNFPNKKLIKNIFITILKNNATHNALNIQTDLIKSHYSHTKR